MPVQSKESEGACVRNTEPGGKPGALVPTLLPTESVFGAGLVLSGLSFPKEKERDLSLVISTLLFLVVFSSSHYAYSEKFFLLLLNESVN